MIKLFNYTDLINFVNELMNLSDDYLTKSFIWAASSYISYVDAGTKQNIETSFCTWINKNKILIAAHDEDIFKLDVEGDIATIINQIGNVWGTLKDVDKEIIWTWLVYFSERC